MTQVIFILLLAASLAFFARTTWIFGRAVFAGVPDPRPRLDDLAARVADIGIYFFGQKKVAEVGPGHQKRWHHLFIFWGFLIITIATVDVVVAIGVTGRRRDAQPRSARSRSRARYTSTFFPLRPDFFFRPATGCFFGGIRP